jgi:hypothetical protein
MNRATARVTIALSLRGNPSGFDGRTIVEISRSPALGRSSNPIRPTRASPTESSGGSNSSLRSGTIEKSSVGPQRRRPRRVVRSRSRDPLLAGHGYSPAMTKVLMHAPSLEPGLPGSAVSSRSEVPLDQMMVADRLPINPMCDRRPGAPFGDRLCPPCDHHAHQPGPDRADTLPSCRMGRHR